MPSSPTMGAPVYYDPDASIPAAAASCRSPRGSEKWTSSGTTWTSRTSSAPRWRSASTSSSTSHSGADAPEVTPTLSTPSNQAGSTAEASGIRWVAQHADHALGLVHRQGGLREIGDLVGVGDFDGGGLPLVADEVDGAWGLAHRPDDLFVAFVTDKYDVIALASELAGLLVDLGHQRAGGVDDLEITRPGLLVDLRGDAVGREDHGRARRDLVQLVHEDGALGLEPAHDVQVVHDLLAHVDGGAIGLEGDLDDVDGPVHTGAVPTRGRQQHAPRG